MLSQAFRWLAVQVFPQSLFFLFLQDLSVTDSSLLNLGASHTPQLRKWEEGNPWILFGGCVCVYVCVCVYICVCVYVYVYLCACVCVYVYVYLCVWQHTLPEYGWTEWSDRYLRGLPPLQQRGRSGPIPYAYWVSWIEPYHPAAGICHELSWNLLRVPCLSVRKWCGWSQGQREGWGSCCEQQNWEVVVSLVQ